MDCCSVPSQPKAADTLAERAAHQHPDGLAEAGDVVNRLAERQSDVTVAVGAFDP